MLGRRTEVWASMRAHHGESSCDLLPDSFPFDSLGCAAAPWLGHDTAVGGAGGTVWKREGGVMNWLFVARLRSFVAQRGVFDKRRVDAETMTRQPASLAGPLAQGASDPDEHLDILRHARHILTPLAVLAALLVLWVLTPPLSGVASRVQPKADTNQKAVLPLEGLVAEVLVRNGQKVRAGQVLIAAGVKSESEAKLLRNQLHAMRIQTGCACTALRSPPTLLR